MGPATKQSSSPAWECFNFISPYYAHFLSWHFNCKTSILSALHRQNKHRHCPVQTQLSPTFTPTHYMSRRMWHWGFIQHVIVESISCCRSIIISESTPILTGTEPHPPTRTTKPQGLRETVEIFLCAETSRNEAGFHTIGWKVSTSRQFPVAPQELHFSNWTKSSTPNHTLLAFLFIRERGTKRLSPQ